MYSNEIETILNHFSNNIDSDTYSHICNTSPQISRIKYDAFRNEFYIETRDNYQFNFRVYPKSKV